MSSLMAVRADAVQEALDNFPVLLLDLDAGRALHILGIGRLQFRRRARLLAEWRGLCMALWRLALQRSFPEHAEAMFRQFRESFGQSHTDKTSALALERAPAYWEVLAERGDADFRPVSRFLAAVFFEDEARAQAMALRQQPGTAPELQTADAEDVQGPSRIQVEEQDGEVVQGLLYRIGTDGHQAAHASA